MTTKEAASSASWCRMRPDGGLRSFLTQLFRSFWRGLPIFYHHLPCNDDHVGWLVNVGPSPSLSAHEATHWKSHSVSTTSWPRLAKVFSTFTRSKAWPKRSSTPRNLRVAMAEIRVQVTSWGRLVVYPIVYKVFYTSKVVVWDFFHQRYHIKILVDS